MYSRVLSCSCAIILSKHHQAPQHTVVNEVTNLYLVHLPRQNIFRPDKKFCSRLKSLYLLVKWMENDFLAMDKIFSSAKKSFSILFQKFKLFSLGQNFLSWTISILSGTKMVLSWTKIILSGQKEEA